MRKRTTNQKNVSATRQVRFRLPLFLTIAALLLVVSSIVIILTFRLQTSQAQHAIATVNANQQQLANPKATAVSTQAPQQVSNSAAKPTSTPTHVVPVTPTPVPATPTLIASTPQQTQYGVFPLSTGGPIPVPETVLRPTNIARTRLNSTLVSVYAGAMTQNPQVGALCVLREDITTGQMHITMYQASQMKGALTILAIQKNIVTFTDSTKAIRTFDLNTNQFQ